MVGSAVATIVWSSAASSIPSIRPANTRRTWRGLSPAGARSAVMSTADISRVPQFFCEQFEAADERALFGRTHPVEGALHRAKSGVEQGFGKVAVGLGNLDERAAPVGRILDALDQPALLEVRDDLTCGGQRHAEP